MSSDFLSEEIRNERIKGEQIRNFLRIDPKFNMLISMSIVFLQK